MLTLAPRRDALGSNLAFALMFLPGDRRRDALVFYRFCRAVDDIADAPRIPTHEKIDRLSEWLEAIPNGRMPDELEAVVGRREIDRTLLAEIVRGCLADCEEQRIETLKDLEQYCWRVACAVGLVSLRIFGVTGPEAVRYAENLGHALQLTNILRDVAQDAGLGRVYLPQSELERYGVSRESILRLSPDRGYIPLARSIADLARARFAAAVIPPGQARRLAAPEIMRALYTAILNRLDCRRFDVFSERVRLARWERTMIALQALARLKSSRF